MANFLTYPIFQEIILPFVLVFVLVYAVLEKARLLGEEKHQINAIISLVIAGILIAFSTQVGWIRQFVVFLVVALVILFVFLLIYGFVYSGKEGFELGKGWKMLIAVIAFIAVIAAVLIITGYWDNVYNFFTASDIGASVVFVIIIVIALLLVLAPWKNAGEKK